MSYDHDDLPGHGRQAGPLRPDWGDGWAELKCDRGDHGWVGPVGEVCPYCEKLIEDLGGDPTNTDHETKPDTPVLDPAALHGVLGEAVIALRPHTEACDAALLVSLATSVGNAVGRGPHVVVESDRHGCALFAALVGRSARARKGTTAGRVSALMHVADEDWCRAAMFSGFGSGEGVVAELADADRGDQRLFVDERELAHLLTAANRDGSTLSSTIRNAWDGVPLRARTKAGRLHVEAHHVSVMGHITRDELQRKLTATETANGFANRFLWVHTYRARLLAQGSGFGPDKAKYWGQRLHAAIIGTRRIELVQRTPAASERWEEIYKTIADSELPGLVGAITNRAEAYVLRLSLLYAVLDGKTLIDVPHLEAAWALWRYCEDSALHIWRDATGDPDLDRLIAAVRRAGDDGLSFTEAYERVFGKHRSVAPIAARGVRAGLLRIEREETDGRPREVMFAHAC